MHSDSGLPSCHLGQEKGLFTQPQKQTWNRNVTGRSPGAGLVLPTWFFSNLPITDTYNISILHNQGKLLLVPLYAYTELWGFPFKKPQKACFHFRYLLSSFLLLTKAMIMNLLIRFIICSHWTRGFGHSFSCLLRTLNLANNKHTDCPRGIQFSLFNNTLPRGDLFLSHIHILLS